MTYDLNKLNNFLKKDAPHTPPTTSPDNNSSINTTSGVLSIPLNTPGGNLISTLKGMSLSQLSQNMSAEFKIPQYAASLVSEYALHCIEKSLSLNGLVRPAVEQRMKVIRNERFPQRGLSPELLDMVENIVSTNKMFLERSGSDSNQAQINTILDRVIKPSMEIVNTFSPLLGLTAASSLLGTFNALDPLRYGFGSDGPKLEDQYVARSGRGSRSEQPLSSRSGGTRTGRLDRNFSGSIDCSGYVLQAIRSIAVDVMLKKGDSVESAVRKANANVKDINTPIMMSQARKDNIGGLSNTPSANEMRQAYREGRIEIGDALVVGPKRSGGPGHTGILALTSDGRLVVHESKSGRGVVERPLEDWAILGNARGGLKIFRHNYLKQLGIFDGKHLMKV